MFEDTSRYTVHCYNVFSWSNEVRNWAFEWQRLQSTYKARCFMKKMIYIHALYHCEYNA